MVVALGAVLVALGGYLAWIQITAAEKLSALAYDQQHMRVPIRPARGNILDSRLRVLAGSVETRSVFADPKWIKDPGDAATKVGRILGERPDEILKKLSAKRIDEPGGRFVKFAGNLSPAAQGWLMAHIAKALGPESVENART